MTDRKMVTTFTDAPAAYDGFGTTTIKVVGTSWRGPVRQVETPAEHAEWQRGRYASGMYLTCQSEENIANLVDHYAPVEPAKPASPFKTDLTRKVYLEPDGDGALIEMPHSSATVHLNIAGRPMFVRLIRSMSGTVSAVLHLCLLGNGGCSDDQPRIGPVYSTPLVPGDAGVRQDGQGYYCYPLRLRREGGKVS